MLWADFTLQAFHLGTLLQESASSILFQDFASRLALRLPFETCLKTWFNTGITATDLQQNTKSSETKTRFQAGQK
ncbi:hypothetical protein B0H11DRAFT_2136730 [Mycena galericulata]|nr:hypothetical protein B0H11DRAFT_2136730 [Mycena galericulata]